MSSEQQQQRQRQRQQQQHQSAPILGLNANGEELLMIFGDNDEVAEFSERMRLRLPGYFDTAGLENGEDFFDSMINRAVADVVGLERPATQPSIENLERIKIETSMEVQVCSICLEQMAVGSEAIRMPEPCSHLYHHDCIVNWLNRSNTCPLCRFQMPSR